MGICDLVPGVSGGTIAFITGIYERLIKAISYYNPKTKIDFLIALKNKDKNKIKEIIKNLDILFLITLILGIGTAIITGSHLISYLLENYFIYVIAFFIGLIIASAKIIYENIGKHTYKNLIFGEIGIILGLLLFFLTPGNIQNPSYLYIILGGFIGISAMFLPGISGSFLLLIMGLYEHIINSVKTFEIKTIGAFAIGAIFGVMIISRIIRFFFEKDKPKTLYVLLGLVIGTLIIPITDLINKIPTDNNYIILSLKLLACTIVGAIIVLIINNKK